MQYKKEESKVKNKKKNPGSLPLIRPAPILLMNQPTSQPTDLGGANKNSRIRQDKTNMRNTSSGSNDKKYVSCDFP